MNIIIAPSLTTEMFKGPVPGQNNETNIAFTFCTQARGGATITYTLNFCELQSWFNYKFLTSKDVL